MKRTIYHCAFIAILLLASGVCVAEEDLPSLEISGFADVLWLINEDTEESEDFAIGQAEIDLAASLSDKVNMEIAVAYDADAGSFGLGALVMDLSLIGSDENNFHQSETVESAGILLGQMDVPFGIDWMFYPSVGRQFITGPTVVSSTHDGWNDLGCAFYMDTSFFSGIIYRLNGSGYEAPYMPVDPSDVEIGSATGGRLAVSVVPAIEVGGSFSSIVNKEGDQASSLMGIDAQGSLGPLYAKGEYIVQKVGQDMDTELEHSGLYFEGMYHPGGYFVLARYGEFTPEGDGFAKESRVCLGAGYVVHEGAELRVEQQFGLDEAPNTTTAQFVVGF